MVYKKYLYSLRYFILFSFLVYGFAAVSGFFLAENFPQEAKIILEEVKNSFEPVIQMNSLSQFFFILFDNSLTSFLIIVFGIIFGAFPFLVLFSNGNILGVVAFFSQQNLSWSTFFMGTLPHGIIEIPVLILAGAVGFKLGKITFKKIFQKQGELTIETSLAFAFFLKFLLPLLVIAAAIEIFVTGQLLKI